MKYGIDCRMWDEAGIGRYLRNLIFSLNKLDKENTYYLFLLKKNTGLGLNKNFVEVEANFRWYGITEQFRLAWLLVRYPVDLMHFPHFNVPILYFGKFVVTIHDLIHQHFAFKRSTTLSPLIHKVKTFGYSTAFEFAVKGSKKILTPSKFVKDQLIKEWGADLDKIVITPEGVDSKILQLIEVTKKDDFKYVSEKFGFTKPYLFYVGNAHPHKNIERLIEAFKQIKLVHPELKLVLSGKKNFFWERVMSKVKDDLRREVIFTGLISDQEMVILYQNALCFVMPSLEEGFGIPVLEAMGCECPVVCSDIPTLKEVAGDSAFYFNPTNEQDMRDKILQVINNARLRAILKQKGTKRVKDFSWEKLAKQTLEVYKSV